MISLYAHLPFCRSKCSYCGFTSFPLGDNFSIIDQYIESLKKEIFHYSELLHTPELKTLYFGGGTPNLLGKGRLIDLIKYIEEYYNLENLCELSFEFNPYPVEEIYGIVEGLQKEFGKRYPRIRFSFGIQSFDNEVLSLAGRPSTFLGLTDFLRGLQPLKQDSTVFNFDFIAFGKWNTSKKGNKYLWTPAALEFFENFVNALFADSFSLYTLELFEHQKWKKKNPEKLISGEYLGNDEEIYEEFSLLKDIIMDAGYSRYEISNFSLAGKSSIHNRVYWDMEEYLGVGLNASSFLYEKTFNNDVKEYFGLTDTSKALRFKDTENLGEYLKGDYLDKNSFESLLDKDLLIERFFLGLRTDRGVSSLSDFESILVPNYKELLDLYKKEGLLDWSEDFLCLTDAGMDVFNSIVTELMQEI